MNRSQKNEYLIKKAVEFDHFIGWTRSHDTQAVKAIHLFRTVEGEPGEDPMVDEDINKIDPAQTLVDYLKERLYEVGVYEDSYEYKIDDTPYLPDAFEHRDRVYPLRLWLIKWAFNPVYKMAPPKIMQQCRKLNKGNLWKKGISVKKKSESTSYKLGQEVRPMGASSDRYQWWFVTSYRNKSGMGAFCLLRSDGAITCTANKLICIEEE